MEANKLIMLKFIKKSFNQYVPASLQQPLKRFFIWPLSRSITFLRDLWLPIYRIERSGLTVILIGHEACDPFSDKVCDPYIMHLLYAEYLDPLRIGTVPLWSLNRVMRRWEKKADLIIFRHRRFRPRGAAARRMLNMPYHVEQIIELPPPDVDLLAFLINSTTRRDLKKIRDAEFQYEITQDPAQLDFFYHQMYRPFVQDRHRGSARIIPWEVFRRIYEKGELMLIRRAGLAVAGNLISQTGDCLYNNLFGVLHADRELFNAGSIAAIYWFAMVEARRRGCATVSMQCARPFLKDGVLVYKKKWGSRIVADHIDREFWLLPCGNRPPMHRFLEENPFICEQDDRLVSLIFLGSHTVLSDKELSSYLRGCHFQGDRLSTWVVLLDSEWAARTETIKNIMRELPQPSHILDLSHGSLAELPELISNWQDLRHGSSTEFPELAYS
jgi:hypothetical protein